jgi:hypothetical protein
MNKIELITEDLIPLKEADYIFECNQNGTLHDEDNFRIGSDKVAKYNGRRKVFYVYSKKEYLGKVFLRDLLKGTDRMDKRNDAI